MSHQCPAQGFLKVNAGRKKTKTKTKTKKEMQGRNMRQAFRVQEIF
jgi:hypothetical protein